MVSWDRLKFLIHKYLIILALVSRVQFPTTQELLIDEFEKHLAWCPECFKTQVQNCKSYLSLAADDRPTLIYDFLRYLPFVEQPDIYHMVLPDGKYVKRFTVKNFKKKMYGMSLSEPVPTIKQMKKNTIEMMKKIFTHKFCPYESVEKLHTEALRHYRFPDKLFWVYASSSIEPLLMRQLFYLRFPVAKHVGACGFLYMQEKLGRTLHEYSYDLNYKFKLLIMKQLLEVTARLTTETFGPFRIYFKDINLHNIAFDDHTEKIYFTDISSIYLVDTRGKTRLKPFYKYNHLKCNASMDYCDEQLCQHSQSDYMVFLVCHFLRGDYDNKPTVGFLRYIPKKIKRLFPDFEKLLELCHECAPRECESRSAYSQKLVTDLIPEMLKKQNKLDLSRIVYKDQVFVYEEKV